MRISLISDTHIGPPSKNISNAASEAFLRKFVSELALGCQPDVIVHLGDHIQHSNDGSDYRTFERVLGYFSDLSIPYLNVVGNHDQVNLSEAELKKLLHLDSLYYSVDIAGYHLVVLFSKTAEPGTFVPAHFPDEQLQWLKHDLAMTKLPVIVVTHYSIAAQNLEGNFWFESRPECAFITNRHDVLDILVSSAKVRAILNGHLHRNEYTVERGVPVFAMQAVVEFQNVSVEVTPAHAWATFEINNDEARFDVYGNDIARFRHTY